MKAEYNFSKAKRGAVIPSTGKTSITIFLDDDILATFRERAEGQGKGYQTLINETLRAAIQHVGRVRRKLSRRGRRVAAGTHRGHSLRV